MFNTLRHKGNANPNDIEIPCHPYQNAHHQENKEEQVLVRIQGKGNLYTTGENVSEFSHYENQYGGSSRN
jgi:hypothetical protein